MWECHKGRDRERTRGWWGCDQNVMNVKHIGVLSEQYIDAKMCLCKIENQIPVIAGTNNYFRSRATLPHCFCLAGHISAKKGYFQAKKTGVCESDVALGPYVAPSWVIGRTSVVIKSKVMKMLTYTYIGHQVTFIRNQN